MAEVVWTAEARRDLAAIGTYLEGTSPAYASAVVGRLYHAAERLEAFPNSGRVVPEFEVEHVRELVVAGYRILYLLSGERVEVLTVVHSRQDVVRKLRRDAPDS